MLGFMDPAEAEFRAKGLALRRPGDREGETQSPRSCK